MKIFGAAVSLNKVTRYLIAGGTATAVNFFVLIILTEYAGIWYLASSGIAFICGITISFTLQKWWTFSEFSTNLIPIQALYYLVVTVAGLVINSASLFVLVSILGMWYIIAQVLVSAIIAPASFFFYHFIFRRETSAESKQLSAYQ